MKKFKAFCLLTALTIVISGCGSAKSTSTTTNSFTPTLEVAYVVKDDTVTIDLTTDLKISKEHYDQQRVSGEGHIHMSLDKGEKMVVTTKQKELPNLSKGPHEVKISLHNNDHTPYDVSKTITFDVK